MPSNRWAVCRGLPIGILGKTYSQPWGKGCPLSEQFSCRLQMSRAWQPSLPLKRKDLDVFGDGPLSLAGWKKKSKLQSASQTPLLVSFQPRTVASFTFRLSFETICGSSDHWHSYFHLLDRKDLSLIQTVLLKRLELPPRPAGRMVTSEREGELGDLGMGQSWCKFAASLLSGSPGVSTSLSPQDLQHPLTLTICTSSPWRELRASPSLNRDLNSKLLEDIGSSASKIIFFSCLWHFFLALGALAIFPQQICKLIFIERITTSQRGFTENQPRGTNPISPWQNGNQAVNWKDAKLWSALISGGHLFPNRDI